jgi:hypothetical protein
MKKKHHWSWVRDELYNKDKPDPPLWQTILIWAVFLIFVIRIAWIIFVG